MLVVFLLPILLLILQLPWLDAFNLIILFILLILITVVTLTAISDLNLWLCVILFIEAIYYYFKFMVDKMHHVIQLSYSLAAAEWPQLNLMEELTQILDNLTDVRAVLYILYMLQEFQGFIILYVASLYFLNDLFYLWFGNQWRTVFRD